MGTLHCALENEADLYVNERQKIRHYRARSAEEGRRRRGRRRMPNCDFFYFAPCVRKIALYNNKMRDSVPSAIYSSVCNVLHLRNISLIRTYRVYRLYDIYA